MISGAFFRRRKSGGLKISRTFVLGEERFEGISAGYAVREQSLVSLKLDNRSFGCRTVYAVYRDVVAFKVKQSLKYIYQVVSGAAS